MRPLFSSVALFVLVALTAALGQTPTPAAPPPGTDIYLFPLTGGRIASIGQAKPVAVATDPGYDNQPAFSLDGSRLLFTANRDGTQTDTWVWDRATARARALWATPEGEYSPTLAPDGGYSVIRVEADGTQRLWEFDSAGANPRLLFTDIKPVGYHAWIDDDVLGLFVLGQPATLQLAKISTGKGDVVASGIGRSLHRIPGTRTIGFVQRESDGEYWVKRIDVDSRQIEPIVKVLTESTDRDIAWMPDGQTLLLSAGTRIFTWRTGDKEWSQVLDVAPLGLGNVSRMTAAANGDALAIVVAEGKK